MPTYLARRYMRNIQQVGRTEKMVGCVLMILLVALVALFFVQIATDKTNLFDVSERPFPEPGQPGWKPPTRVSRFTPSNLYEKIDGQADAYLRFHAVGLTFGTYYNENDSGQAVDVYWYDMGEPENASGIYRSEAPPDAEPVAIGNEGYRVGGAVFFRYAAQYVQVLPTSRDEPSAKAALSIARHLAERIGASANLISNNPDLP